MNQRRRRVAAEAARLLTCFAIGYLLTYLFDNLWITLSAAILTGTLMAFAKHYWPHWRYLWDRRRPTPTPASQTPGLADVSIPIDRKERP